VCAYLVGRAVTRRQVLVAATIGVLILGAVCGLVFGPARGLRDDIAHVRTDLNSSRHGIYGTLATSRTTLERTDSQLRATEKSLVIQQQGLTIAADTRRISGAAAQHSADILRDTTATLNTVRRVVAALGPLAQLTGKIETVTKGVQTGVALARSTLALAQRTLTTGKAALAVAVETLRTLRQSKQVQEQLLVVARQTLEQTRQINRKIPTPAVFPP
jgi:chromosome segregation ATPase